MGFLARWLSDALHLGLALALALMAMQVPALAQQYTAALLQITEVALATRPDAQHAEPAVGIVVGDPLHQPGQRLGRGSVQRLGECGR